MKRGKLLFAFFKYEQLHDWEKKQKLNTAILQTGLRFDWYVGQAHGYFFPKL